MLNAQYHKNQNYDEIKTHHYLISFDPADKDECGLTGEQAQAIGISQVNRIPELFSITVQVCHYKSPSFLPDFCIAYPGNKKNTVPFPKGSNLHRSYIGTNVPAKAFP